jgi:ATP-dependent DNA helicase RecG
VNSAQLRQHLDALISGWEGECVEFKAASNDYDTSDIGKYFSALSNEANLRARSSAWLVFGIENRTRTIAGTAYRLDREHLHSLKQQIAENSYPSTTFREIYELSTPQGRVILFEIPPAPRGIPIAWKTHYYARNGESITGLSIAKLDEIRSQSVSEDWSAVICRDATLNDLSPEAVVRAREIYAGKYADRLPLHTIRSWSNATFLEKAKLTIGDAITRTCLLLLGRPESTRHLLPSVAEISWKLEGLELAYEHFHPPFLLATTALYQRIRNIRLTLLPPGQMIPLELSKYDQRIVLEALHNCVAHQDYTRQERILVVERPGELLFQNAGSFFDGTPDDYIRTERTPTRYRNRFLAEAMVHLRMIDTMGFGIREVMWKGQARRYFPLPDFDLSDLDRVVLRLPGRFIDENYSRALLTHADLPWPEILAIDAIQKGLAADEDLVASLRYRGLIEGRKPNLHLAAEIAAATETEAEYIRHRAFDDRYFCDLILEYLKKFETGQRADFERLLEGKLSDLLDEKQKVKKIHNLLQRLRREGRIEPKGRTSGAVWRLANFSQF